MVARSNDREAQHTDRINSTRRQRRDRARFTAHIGGKRSLAFTFLLAGVLLVAPVANTLGIPGQSFWIQSSELHPDAPGSETNFGSALAMGGETLAIGAPGDGVIFVYERSDSTWVLEAELWPSGSGQEFGQALAISEDGERIVVGARGESAVYIYDRTDVGWDQTGHLTVPGTGCFGRSVDISGPLVLASAPCVAGEVHIFEEGEDGWTTNAVLQGQGTFFGWSVALDGDTLVVTRANGPASVFRLDQAGWAEEATLPVPASAPAGSAFGTALALHEETVVIGAHAAKGTPGRTGAAYVYDRGVDGWREPIAITPQDLAPLEPTWVSFGASLNLGPGTLVVGAPGDDPVPVGASQIAEDQRDPVCRNVPRGVACQYPGAAYVFERDGDGWNQVTKLTAPDAPPVDPTRSVLGVGETDRFGSAVAIIDGGVAVGAPHTDMQLLDETGAVHLFQPFSLGGAV